MQTEVVVEMLREVGDPEIPSVSIVDLGMVGRIQAAEEGVQVDLMPTFVGCSAQRIIQERVVEKLRDAFPGSAVTVRFDLSEPWTSERITEAGREGLRKAGIAPPGPTLDDVECPYCGQSSAVLHNLFGATSCRSLYYCSHCKNPFEAFKPL